MKRTSTSQTVKDSLALVLITSVPLALSTARADAQTTTRASVAAGAAEGNAGSRISWGRSCSADGRLVTFPSDATNLVPGDTNGFKDIFVRDRQVGTTELVSMNVGGTSANNYSEWPVISSDGRFVGFVSGATDLVAGDSNGFADVFVRDRLSQSTYLVSVSSAGVQANSPYHGTVALSADGRFVAFLSSASNLVAGDTNGYVDVFVRDRQLSITERVSVASNGAQGNGYGGGCAMSGDGRYVAWDSRAGNLVPGDSNGKNDIFLRDRLLAITQVVSVSPAGAVGDGHSSGPSISADGRFVAFDSVATNLVSGVSGGVFVRDLQLGSTEHVSLSTSGVPGGGGVASISGDGRYVAFVSASPNLVPSDTNGFLDIFLRDRVSGTTDIASVSTDGTQGTADVAAESSISENGRVVVFGGTASNLVVGDTNALDDVFIRDMGQPAPVVYCAAKPNSLGCLPSISGLGTSSTSASYGFIVRAVNLRNHTNGLLFYGVSGRASSPFQAGTLCVNTPVKRAPSVNSGGTLPPVNDCSGVSAIDVNAFAMGVLGGNPFAALSVPGTIVNCQWWGSDPGFAVPNNTQLSGGLEYTVLP